MRPLSRRSSGLGPMQAVRPMIRKKANRRDGKMYTFNSTRSKWNCGRVRLMRHILRSPECEYLDLLAEWPPATALVFRCVSSPWWNEIKDRRGLVSGEIKSPDQQWAARRVKLVLFGEDMHHEGQCTVARALAYWRQVRRTPHKSSYLPRTDNGKW